MAEAELDERFELDFEEEDSVEEDDVREEDGLGIAPYMFEPEDEFHEEQMPVDTANSSPHPEDHRLGNTSWFVYLLIIYYQQETLPK